MHIVLRIGTEWFEWNSEKSDLNAGKQSVSFDEAAQVFQDPMIRVMGTRPTHELRELICSRRN